MEEINKIKKQILEGEVVSNRMSKTIVIKVTRLTPHSKYGKIIKKVKKFMVHDEKEQCKIGDSVRVASCRPISKNKKWRILTIIKKGKGKEEIEDIINDEKIRDKE